MFVLLHIRMTAHRQHHDVGVQVANGRHIGSGVHPQVYVQSRQLQLVPPRDTGHLVALRGFGGGRDLPTNRLFFLKHSYVVPALSSHPRCFHPGRACAHDHHFAFRPRGFLDDVRYAHVFTRRRRVLNAQHIQPLVLAIDAVVGAHALFDLVDLAHFDFGDQVRVSDVGAGHTDHVHVATFQNACGLVRVFNVLRVQHGRLNHFFDASSQVQKRLRRKAHVRDHVGQGVVRVAPRADHADEVEHAGVVVILGNLFHVLVAQAIGVKLVAAQANAHAEIRANFGAHSLKHFQAKAHAVFKTAAPLIGALVNPRAPELVDHVLVHRRQFHTVQPAFFSPTRRTGVVADNAPDFFGLNGFTSGAVHRLTYTGR